MKLIKQLTIAICIGCLILINNPLNALAEEIFPELSGAELLSKVAQEYKGETLGYRRGREVMYTDIDNEDGIVTGIYTGYSISVDPNSDTSRQDTYRQDINAEHIYPQSKGARGKARSDLHSLFPCKIPVNRERSNNPYTDIDDSQTEKWFLNTKVLRTIPTESIDEYSESITGEVFEPREIKKGDVARAMFYFYTIYRYQADEKDPHFFPSQQKTLCIWNDVDPVDSSELERSHKIASYQGNENPFVIDSTLAERTYCE